MESLARLWNSIAGRLRGNADDALSEARGPSPEPLDFPEDLEPMRDARLQLDWFSTDLYSFALDKSRQG